MQTRTESSSPSAVVIPSDIHSFPLKVLYREAIELLVKEWNEQIVPNNYRNAIINAYVNKVNADNYLKVLHLVTLFKENKKIMNNINIIIDEIKWFSFV